MTKAIVIHLYKELNGSFVTKMCPTLGAPWTVAHWALLSTGFSRQEYRSGLLFPSPGNLPDPGIQPRSPALQTYSSLTELPGEGGQAAISFTPDADGTGSVFLLDSILSTLFKK